MTKSRLGPVVATGSRSTVHARGRDAVVKVPRDATPDAWIRDEATYSDAARRIGAPVPEFLGFDRHRGRLVSVYRRARGPAMSGAIVAEPSSAEAHGRTLARLQAELAAHAAPIAVPRQVDRLRCKLRLAAKRVDPALDEVARSVPVITRHSLCHGDLHPSNIVLTADGPMLVDWFDACRGEPIGDVARTWLLLSPTLSASHLGATPDVLVDRVRTAYLDAIREALAIDDHVLAQWQAVVAVARIAEGFDSRRLLEVWRRWKERGAPTPGSVVGLDHVANRGENTR